jgi:transcriptional regulator with XRE-family HTH domain
MQVRSLRRRIGYSGISQAELAARSGVSKKCIQRMETTRSLSPEVRALIRVADALQVRIADMFHDSAFSSALSTQRKSRTS